jgi:hypothetical protein
MSARGAGRDDVLRFARLDGLRIGQHGEASDRPKKGRETTSNGLVVERRQVRSEAQQVRGGSRKAEGSNGTGGKDSRSKVAAPKGMVTARKVLSKGRPARE